MPGDNEITPEERRRRRISDVVLLIASAAAIAAAMLRVFKGASFIDPDKIDATTLGFLFIPVACVLLRDAKKLKLGKEGVEFERIERDLKQVREDVKETKQAVAQNQEAIDVTRLAVVHDIGKNRRPGTMLPGIPPVAPAPAGASRAAAGGGGGGGSGVRVAGGGGGGPAYSPGAFAGGGGGAPATSTPAEDDPQKGRWGGLPERDGRRLSASVKEVTGEPGWYRIHLEVRSTDATKPLTGSVTFHLHPTFRDPDPVVPVRDGVAELERIAWGAFTIGAETDGGRTKLELDLATLPEAPAEFRAR